MAISRILLATDFSKGGERALQYAVAWAKRLGAHVDILHVVEFQPGMDADQPVSKMYLDDQRHRAEGQLKRVVALSADAGLKAEALLRVGIPSQSIIATAQELDSDLVALGTRGVTGLEHLLVGSTAERVIRGSPCPVLTVRTPRDHTTGEAVGPRPPCQTSLDHILVPVDFSDCSLDALEYAILVARTGQANLTILHVLEPISFGIDFTLRHVEERRAMRKRIDAWLNRVVEALRLGGMQASYQLEGGVAQDAILSRCQEQPCDLIVMGTHGRRGISHLVSGSVAEAVIRHAPCPVLTVRSPKFAPGHERVVTDRVDLPVFPASGTKQA